MAKDAGLIKENIMSLFQRNGPSLPIHVGRATGLSLIFASAFLSELLSERKLKLSTLRVGSSPVYFIPGQESQLERFAHHLKSKEKDAFELLKEKRFLKDSEQDPAIRVALRFIKDFAIPFKNDEEIYWRYFTTTEDEIRNIFEKKDSKQKPEKVQELEIIKVPASQDENLDTSEDKQILKEEFENKELEIKPPQKEKPHKKPKKKLKKKPKQDDKFFNKVKDYLSERSIEILDIEGANKDNLTLKIKTKEGEKLLIAYNKKKISEAEIIKAYKKSLEYNQNFIILSLGETSKKLSALIDALKNLDEIERIE